MAKKTRRPGRTIEALDQILAAMVDYRLGLGDVVKDPAQLEAALLASDEMAKNLRDLRDIQFRARRKVEAYVRAQKKAKTKTRGEEFYAAGCADGATAALALIEE